MDLLSSIKLIILIIVPAPEPRGVSALRWSLFGLVGFLSLFYFLESGIRFLFLLPPQFFTFVNALVYKVNLHREI